MSVKVRLENTANPTVERCIHCDAELKTWQELNDQVCDSCATTLTCDEGDYVEE